MVFKNFILDLIICRSAIRIRRKNMRRIDSVRGCVSGDTEEDYVPRHRAGERLGARRHLYRKLMSVRILNGIGRRKGFEGFDAIVSLVFRRDHRRVVLLRLGRLERRQRRIIAGIIIGNDRRIILRIEFKVTHGHGKKVANVERTDLGRRTLDRSRNLARIQVLKISRIHRSKHQIAISLAGIRIRGDFTGYGDFIGLGSGGDNLCRIGRLGTPQRE